MKSKIAMNHIISRIAEEHSVSPDVAYSEIGKALQNSPSIDFSSAHTKMRNTELSAQTVEDYILSLAILASIRMKK